MTYDPHAKPKLDGVWRPEPHFAGNEWICVSYVAINRQRTERRIQRMPMIRGMEHLRPIHRFDTEAAAQAMCDALNKVEGKA